MAGLAEALLGAQNPLTQWANQNQNFRMALASGLAGGPDFGTGLAQGLKMAPQARMLDLQLAREQEEQAKEKLEADAFKGWLEQNRPDLAPLLDAGVDRGTLFNQAMKQPEATDLPSSVQEYEYARSSGFGGTYMDWLSGKGGASERSLTPTYLRDANGNIVIGQMDKAGNVTPSAIPDGMAPIDPFQMAGGKAGATVDAKTAAAARAALPSAEQMMDITNRAVSEVRSNAKGMNEWFSQWGPRGVYVNPGSEMGKFIAAANPTNAQAFMQARNMLKGGGQITDYEGRRAEDAISRMQAAIDKGDQDQYLRALADFEQAVAEGYAKLVATAQGGYSSGGFAMPQGQGVGTDEVEGILSGLGI